MRGWQDKGVRAARTVRLRPSLRRHGRACPGHPRRELSSDRVIEIAPVRIARDDQSDFPGSRPMFDILFPLDRSLNAVVLLEIDQPLDTISFGKSRDQSVSMLIDATDKIAGHPDIEDPIRRAC